MKLPSHLTFRGLALAASIGGVTVLAGFFLSHLPGSVFAHIASIAAWFRGGPKPDVVTWPAWGYAWVVAAVPSIDWIVPLQAGIGAVALFVFIRRLQISMPRQATLLSVLGALAIPWYVANLSLYPNALAGSLALFAILLLDEALTHDYLKPALLAGVLMGLAQNFRTEFVLLPAFLIVFAYILKAFGILRGGSFKTLWIFGLTALTLQLPWAMFYHENTGRFSLTESNFGHVLYVSLGSRPDNPWGIEANDQAAAAEMLRQGYSSSSLSEQGNKVLLRLALQNIRGNPHAVVERTLQQLRNTILAPFNWGEPKLDQADARDLDVLRQELKARLGVGVNVLKLERQREQNLYPEARTNTRALLALLYQIGSVGLGSLVLLISIAGMLLAFFRRRATPMLTMLWLAAGTAIYKILQDVLLAYQVNYLNNIYPLFLPFVALTLTSFRDTLGAWARRRQSGSSSEDEVRVERCSGTDSGTYLQEAEA